MTNDARKLGDEFTPRDDLAFAWERVAGVRYDDPFAEKGMRYLIATLRRIADGFEARVEGAR